jgi:hypothetical protein
MEGLRMNRTAVNLGAGGFVSYMEDGGATVIVDDGSMQLQEAPEYDEKGVLRFVSDNFNITEPERDIPLPLGADQQSAIGASGQAGSELQEVFYPEGAPPFYDQLAEQYGYPAGVDPLSGPRRFDRPRSDLPTPQELRDTRQHMLASALAAMEYGPRTAARVGDLNELGANRLHQAMDKRNNAVGISLFKQAGINATPAQIAQMVDKTILDQLNTILNRPESERSYKSPATGPDVYFPRDEYQRFIRDH